MLLALTVSRWFLVAMSPKTSALAHCSVPMQHSPSVLAGMVSFNILVPNCALHSMTILGISCMPVSMDYTTPFISTAESSQLLAFYQSSAAFASSALSISALALSAAFANQ
jgi:hypothetical protein